MNTQLEYIKIIIHFREGTFTYSKKIEELVFEKYQMLKSVGLFFIRKKYLKWSTLFFGNSYGKTLSLKISDNVFYILEKIVNKNKVIQNHD